MGPTEGERRRTASAFGIGEAAIAGITVGLQDAGVPAQQRRSVIAAAPRCIVVHHRRWCTAAPRSVVWTGCRSQVRACCRKSLICIQAIFSLSAPFKRQRGGAVRFSPQAELSLRQGISLQTSHPAEDVPTTVPHSGRESSKRAAPLCETALRLPGRITTTPPGISMPDTALQSGLNSKADQ